jgi:hypothetical protein
MWQLTCCLCWFYNWKWRKTCSDNIMIPPHETFMLCFSNCGEKIIGMKWKNSGRKMCFLSYHYTNSVSHAPVFLFAPSVHILLTITFSVWTWMTWWFMVCHEVFYSSIVMVDVFPIMLNSVAEQSVIMRYHVGVRKNSGVDVSTWFMW